jgi:hypothetical protein
MTQLTPPGLTDDDLRAKWRAAGGRFHGSIVETGTMPAVYLLPFLRSTAVSHREVAMLVADALKASHPTVAPVTEDPFEHAATLDAYAAITRSIADTLAGANSEFNRESFFVACGLDLEGYLITDEGDSEASPDDAHSKS